MTSDTMSHKYMKNHRGEWVPLLGEPPPVTVAEWEEDRSADYREQANWFRGLPERRRMELVRGLVSEHDAARQRQAEREQQLVNAAVELGKLAAGRPLTTDERQCAFIRRARLQKLHDRGRHCTPITAPSSTMVREWRQEQDLPAAWTEQEAAAAMAYWLSVWPMEEMTWS